MVGCCAKGVPLLPSLPTRCGLKLAMFSSDSRCARSAVVTAGRLPKDPDAPAEVEKLEVCRGASKVQRKFEDPYWLSKDPDAPADTEKLEVCRKTNKQRRSEDHSWQPDRPGTFTLFPICSEKARLDSCHSLGACYASAIGSVEVGPDLLGSGQSPVQGRSLAGCPWSC